MITEGVDHDLSSLDFTPELIWPGIIAQDRLVDLTSVDNT